MDLLSIPNYHIKKGRPHGHRYGKKPGDHEYYIANSLKKKCKKKFYLGIHDRFIRDEKFRKNMPVARRKCVARWANWPTKTIRTTWLQKKFEDTEPTGGFVQTKLVPIRCQSGIDLTSSKHCQPCDSSKTKRMQLISKDGRKAVPRFGGTGKNPGGILLMSITTNKYPALIDPGKPDEKWLGHLFEVWFSELICWSTVQNSVAANSSLLSPTGGVNTIPPIQKNHT